MTKARKARRASVAHAPLAEASGHVWLLRVAAAGLAAIGLLPMANFVTDGVGLPWWSDAVRQWLVWIPLVVVIALVLGRTFTEQIESAFAHAKRILLAPTSRVFALGIGAVTCALSLYFGWRLFGLQPVVGDEFAQRFQANLLTKGRLFALGEAHPEFFSTIQTLELQNRWFSQFPIGGPALLAIGVVLRAPWLINPLLAGITAIALHDFVRSIADETTARVAALLFALSPLVLFMSGSQMNHAGTLACLTIALAAVARWVVAVAPRGASGAAATIGASLGVAATIRPFDAAVVALVIGTFQLVTGRTNAWFRRSLIVQVAAGLVPVLLLFAANWATVGRPFAFAYDVLNGPEHRPGFHMTPLGFEHTPVRAVYMASAYLMKLDVGLFAWPVPAMLVIVLALALQRRATRWDYLLLAILGGFLLGYASYWSESYFVGPRFLYAAVPVLVFYTARMTAAIRDRTDAPSLRAAALLLVPLWLMVAWLAPVRERQLYGVRELAHLYRMQSTAGAISDAVKSAGIAHALVFIPEGWHSRLASRLRAYGVRPLAAEQLVIHSDACRLHQALDAADRAQVSLPSQRIQIVTDVLARDATPSRLAAQPPNEQIALVRGRALSAECTEEMSQLQSRGASIAAMLPAAHLDARGALGGDIVYARDFGRRNPLLADRFGDRAWYVAWTAFNSGKLVVTLDRLR